MIYINSIETRITISTEAQLKTLENHLKLKHPTCFLHCSNHQKCFPYKIRKERANRSTNNEDMVDKAKRDVVSEGEKMSFKKK